MYFDRLSWLLPFLLLYFQVFYCSAIHCNETYQDFTLLFPSLVVAYSDASITLTSEYTGPCDVVTIFQLLQPQNISDNDPIPVEEEPYDISRDCSNMIITATFNASQYFNGTLLELSATPDPGEGDSDNARCSDIFTVITQGPVSVGDISLYKNFTGIYLEWLHPWTRPNTSISYYIVTVDTSVNNSTFNTTSNNIFIPYDTVGANEQVTITVSAYNGAGYGNDSIVYNNTSVVPLVYPHISYIPTVINNTHSSVELFAEVQYSQYPATNPLTATILVLNKDTDTIYSNTTYDVTVNTSTGDIAIPPLILARNETYIAEVTWSNLDMTNNVSDPYMINTHDIFNFTLNISNGTLQLTCTFSNNSTIYGCAVVIAGVYSNTILYIPQYSATSTISGLCIDIYDILVYNAYTDDSYDNDDVIWSDTVTITGGRMCTVTPTPTPSNTPTQSDNPICDGNMQDICIGVSVGVGIIVILIIIIIPITIIWRCKGHCKKYELPHNGDGPQDEAQVPLRSQVGDEPDGRYDNHTSTELEGETIFNKASEEEPVDGHIQSIDTTRRAPQDPVLNGVTCSEEETVQASPPENKDHNDTSSNEETAHGSKDHCRVSTSSPDDDSPNGDSSSEEARPTPPPEDENYSSAPNGVISKKETDEDRNSVPNDADTSSNEETTHEGHLEHLISPSEYKDNNGAPNDNASSKKETTPQEDKDHNDTMSIPVTVASDHEPLDQHQMVVKANDPMQQLEEKLKTPIQVCDESQTPQGLAAADSTSSDIHPLIRKSGDMLFVGRKPNLELEKRMTTTASLEDHTTKSQVTVHEDYSAANIVQYNDNQPSSQAPSDTPLIRDSI